VDPLSAGMVLVESSACRLDFSFGRYVGLESAAAVGQDSARLARDAIGPSVASGLRSGVFSTGSVFKVETCQHIH
jgi:hypothetical protein